MIDINQLGGSIQPGARVITERVKKNIVAGKQNVESNQLCQYN